MNFFAELHGTDGRMGGKARSLAQLAAAGLRTPAGFVVTDELFRAMDSSLALPERIDDAALAELDRARDALLAAPFPAGFSQDLAARLAQAPDALWSVRSSFAGEDVAGRLGAGVYESRVAVRATEVETAIRQVLSSALSAGAVAYALAHGLRPAAPPLSVLLHAYVRGDAEGGAACLPERPDEALIQVRAGALAAAAEARLRSALTMLAKDHGAVELEWVAEGEVVTFLQMRPFEPPPAPAPWRGWDDLAGESPAPWRWDQAHNPLPLSPAHAGLVALVDERCRIGIRQRVLGQYLFYAPDARPKPTPVPVEDAPARFAALRAEIESRLAALGTEPELEPALDLLLAIEEPIFGIIQPALRTARANLREFLRQEGLALALGPLLAGVESMASERRRRAAAWRDAQDMETRAQARDHYLDLFGDETPVWDVAVPTCRETQKIQWIGDSGAASVPTEASPAEAITNPIAPARREEWDRLLRLARQAVGLGEDDDWLYARVQASLRRALSHLGKTLRQTSSLTDVDAVFYLSLPLLRSLAAGSAPPTDLAVQAAAGRAAWEAACRDPPPAPNAPDTVSVAGAGTGGRALGRVVLHRPASPRPAPGQILVAPTFLPSELPLLVAAALVSETGGPLDHVATQARERRLPAVVGAAGACRIFRDGDLVLVDADRGLVVKLG
jgi:phosphohistidine swiveling domain-containing protein